jgi:signal transduction histidine kinase
VDVSELIREIVPRTRTSILRTVRLDLSLTDKLPPINADASQVQQAVMNLVVNGAEAVGEGKPGRIEVRTSLRRISAREALEEFSPEQLSPGPHVVIEISDTGVGMSDASMARIFDPFFSTKFTGRGLGLAATLGIVRAHGGALRVRSAVGCGSTFSVLFPVGVVPEGSRE